MTADDVADELGIHRATVYRLMAAGELEHHDYPSIGKRVTRDQLNRFLASHLVPARASDDGDTAVAS